MTTTGVTYNHKNGHFWQLDFTGKERDPETGYSYFGARYLDHTPLTLWLSVDPMADKYPSISPYAYCAWNPIKYMDPQGDTIYNAYEQYKDVSQQIISLNKDKNRATFFKRLSLQRQINNLKKMNLYYTKVQGALDAFKEKNPEEYDRLNQLSSLGKSVNIIVYVNMDKAHSENNGIGETELYYNEEPSTNNLVGISLIKITLFHGAFSGDNNGLSTLANEFGDAIYGIAQPQKQYQGYLDINNNNISYWKECSSRFSFAYERFIMQPEKYKKTRP